MAATSKTFATVATYPYQVIRSRLQDHRLTAVTSNALAPRPYTGVLDVMRRVFQSDGLRGFYRGLGANILRVLPGTCITFAVYESVSATLAEW